MLFILEIYGVLAGIFVQQSKYGRSIFLGIYYLLNGDEQALKLTKILALGIFAVSYFGIVAKLFFHKNANSITFRKTIRTYQIFLVIFTFVLITNFNPWYVIWLFPTLFWQKASQIRMTTYLSMGALNSYVITYATGNDGQIIGIPYLIVMILTIAILELGRQIKLKMKDKVRS